MTLSQFRRTIIAIVGVSAPFLGAPVTRAQGVTSTTFEETVPPGGNYDTAAFRLWYPKDVGRVRAVLLLVPGSGEDGRSMVEDSVWRAFAIRHKLALVGCYITDRPHPQDFIEEYADVSKGSGQALLTALTAFAGHSGHPELAAAPLLLWGVSAGGEFDYEFAAWKPERVIAFVANKGGIYYTALTPRATWKVPGLLFIGRNDLDFRINTIVGLFAVNRRAGALWALTEEPNVAHDVGRSEDLAKIFFEDMLAFRLNNSVNGSSPNTLNVLAEKSGYLGDLKAKTIQPVGDTKVPNYPTAWLPTERVARAWRAVVTDTPFDTTEH